MTTQTHVPVNGAEVVDLRGGRRRLRPVPPPAVGPVGDPEPQTKRPSRVANGVTGALAVFGADATDWRLAATAPPSLTDWVAAGRDTGRVPDDWRLRTAWHVDHWTVGLTLAAVSVALFTAAATVRWVACHPARRWVFLGLTCTYVAWLSQA